MRIRYEAISHVGAVRSRNEDMAYIGGQTIRDDSDSFEFQIPAKGMKFGAIVCDGLGGRADGDRASRMACEMFESFVDDLPEGLDANELIQHIKRWFHIANESIMTAAAGNGMATTMTGLLLYFDQAYLVNSGDSQVYRLRHENFRLLTKDHSERERLNDSSAPAHLMYNCLGIEDAFIDVTPTRIVEGDRYVICSDGLSDYVDVDEIERHSSSATDLLHDAMAQGAPDNVTLIVIDFMA